MQLLYDVKQRSDEWFKLRERRVTSSHAQAIGNCGKGLTTYIINMMSAYYSSVEAEQYTNKAIQNGVDLESEARSIFELESGKKVKEIGFIIYNQWVGGSPDGLIDDDGMTEIKCLSDTVYFRYLMTREIDSEYMWQMQMNLLIAKRKYCEYIVYNPNFKHCQIVQTVTADLVMHEKLEKGFKISEDLIKKYVDTYENIAP